MAAEIAEDEPLTVQLSGSDPEGEPVIFRMIGPPAHGHGSIDAHTGQLLYQPEPDFFGTDTIAFVVIDVEGLQSDPAAVTITVRAVNDAPIITAPEEARNSAYTYETRIDFSATDVDSPTLDLTVSIEPTDVARVMLEGETIVVEPLRRGSADIHLRASDSELTADAVIRFIVDDVTKTETLEFERPSEQAVAIRNRIDRVLDFRLATQGVPSFASLDEVAEFVKQLPAAYPGEQFPSKLWRFVRDNVSHDYPLSEETWIYDPLVTLNSLGWGLCSNVASLYVRVARAAGFEARVWGIGGHVIPELRVDTEWQMFDPDLAVFYFDRTGKIAGVATLSTDSSLVSEPVDPIHDPSGYPAPYNTYVTSLYASESDNLVMSDYDGPDEPLDGTVRLPAGATLIYPGIWDEAPVGYDGGMAFAVTAFRHAAIVLPADFTGSVKLPWMLRTIQGVGRVRINGTEYDVGSAELSDFLAYPRTIIREIEVIHSEGELRLVFYLNVARSGLAQPIEVSVTGLDVWAADIEMISLPPENRLPDVQLMGFPAKPKSRLEQ